MTTIDVADLAGVVYSSGKVFDGLDTGRLDTENFLRSGSLSGVTSRSDLALLKDLRDVAQFIIEYAQSNSQIDTDFVRSVNATITRSGALHPGEFRTQSQQIGVQTRYGPHVPDPVNVSSLTGIIDSAMAGSDIRESALDLFIELAKAQPFEDGNKRTALFVANAALIIHDVGEVLTIPVDDSDPSVADSFNDLLARAYIMDEHDPVKEMLRNQGFAAIGG